MGRIVFVTGGTPGASDKVDVSDVAANLADGFIWKGGVQTSLKAKYCLITIETNPVRYCLGGATPTQAGKGHYVRVGDVVKLASFAAIKSFMFINHTNGANAVLQITSEF